MRAFLCLLLIAGCGEVVPNQGGVCTTAADCTDPARAFCVDGQCQATCATAVDCTDPASPVCAADGACVGCETADQCTAAAPVCDASARACRGCAEDSECPGGICVEATGTCVADAEVAFVTMMGDDTGTCTRAAPCATIPFALDKQRTVHVLGGTLAATDTLVLTGTLVLDGEDTTLQVGSPTKIAVRGPSNVTIEGFRMRAPTGGTTPGVLVTGPMAVAVFEAVAIDGDGSLVLRAATSADVTLQHVKIGSLSATTSNVVACEGSKLKVDRAVFETSRIADNNLNCEAVVSRTRFDSARDGSIQMSGPNSQLVAENNLIVHRDGFNDSMLATGMRPGSTIRFNTFVNTTALPSDGAALSCDNSIEVTSNIFAYNSGHPITGTGCVTRFSVFDDVSTTSAGTGNQVVGIDAIFANRAAGDFHLAATSVAREGAEPGQTMVEIDLEGTPRPNPAGTVSDSGAFEAP